MLSKPGWDLLSERVAEARKNRLWRAITEADYFEAVVLVRITF
jgi:hypothetical protein